MRTQLLNLVAAASSNQQISPRRAEPGEGWGLYIHPRRSGAGNELIAFFEDGDPAAVFLVPTGCVVTGIKCRSLTVAPPGTQGPAGTPMAGGLTGGAVLSPAYSQPTSGGYPSTPDDLFVPVYAGSPNQNWAGIAVGVYWVNVLEPGENFIPTMRNLKPPRCSIANTGATTKVVGGVTLPINPTGGYTTTFNATAIVGPFDTSLFDSVNLLGYVVSFVGGASPTLQVAIAPVNNVPIVTAFSVSQSAIASGGTFGGQPSALTAFGSPYTNNNGAPVTVQAQLEFIPSGSPTSFTVNYDFEGR